MKKRNLALWIVLIVLVSPIVYLASTNWVFVKYLLKDIPYFGDEFKMIDPSKEIMHIKIGDYIADIPSNYFWRDYVFNGVWWKTSPERIEIDAINLEVTWPGLMPWSPERDKLFTEPGSPKTISTTFNLARNEDWPFHYFKNKRQDLTLITDSNEAPGLLHFKEGKRQRDIFLEYDKPTLGMIKLICDPENSGVPSPSCTCRNSVLLKKYDIKYTFHRSLLPEWREIDNGLKAMYSSFIVSTENM